VVTIRLVQVGARNRPYYRIAVIGKAAAHNRRLIEVVGTYDPRTRPSIINLKRDRIAYWQSKGAEFSPAVKDAISSYILPDEPFRPIEEEKTTAERQEVACKTEQI